MWHIKKITKISQQKKKKNRYSIYIDEEFAFGVDEDVIVLHNLQKGMELEDDYIEDVIKAEEQSKANNYALNLLSYRARSTKEIKDKMKLKGYEEDNIENTIDFLNKYNYLNDFEFGLLLAKDKQNLKGAGEKLIKQELYQKGIKHDIVNKILSMIIDQGEEYKRALKLAKKKANTSYKNDDEVARYRKLSSFLMRKGYSYNIIGKIMKELEL